MKNNHQNGFTIIELLIAISIITILSTIGYATVSKQMETNAILKMRNQIPTFIKGISELSYETGEKYDISIDFNNYIITAKKNGSTTIYRKLNLEKNLQYCFIDNNNKIQNTLSRNTTSTGNINIGFSIYIFNKKNKAKSKISFVSTTKVVKFLVINRYTPKKDMYLNNFTQNRVITGSELELKDSNNWEKVN
ncbi:prepilin-type N-terminal cleavage/methylation domain-containing protein [Hypnocyclicus thermotrophus]|uniref:Prepilin-type N-terminal cleavage/methylation domain-containing protein n=1 Tax=Hypnocyclicus thermotrophus TaxID=1627895 RepID=A0AA46DXI4_9FUSO|nr:prepilin-type N-terminal cleavage/methylation domain-containing protein [Hypnocyclicus thermotrophus]TDT68031.1 prepilin-type N-terminal cleavage/methylation domain-containing protein [Hypnocyclicus thermotrophus]